MFDTYVTVVGTALTTPERRVLAKTNAVVASFRVASHARRFDRSTQEWVDAANLRIRVTCWRRLAENVCGSIFTGDAVVVYGRISTRDWVNEQGEARIAYELDAVSVGHDLARGTATFTRNRAEQPGVVVEDADAETQVGGEPVRTAGGDAGVDPAFDDFGYGDAPAGDDDALAILREAGLGGDGPGEGDDDAEPEESAAARGARRRGRQPVPA